MKTILEQIKQEVKVLQKLGYGDWKAHQKQEDKVWSLVRKLDEESGDGLVVGRHVRWQVADGYAEYIVTRVLRNDVELFHLDIADGYIFQGVYEYRKKLLAPRPVVERQLMWNDGLRELFGGKNFESKSRI